MRLYFTQLEERVVLDAALVDALTDDAAVEAAESIEVSLEGEQAASLFEDGGTGLGAQLLLVPDSASNIEDLMSQVPSGVEVIVYSSEASLDEILAQVDESLGGQMADEIAFYNAGGSEAFSLADSLDVNADSLENNAEMRDFWVSLGSRMNSGADVHLLGLDAADASMMSLMNGLLNSPAEPSSGEAFGAFEEALGATMSTHSIGGTIYEDVEVNGAIDATDLTFSGVDVDLYLDDGDGLVGAGDSLVASATTDANGDYLFSGLADGTYYVVVDSDSITPNVVFQSSFNPTADQTFGVFGSALGGGFTAADGALFGGRDAAVADDASALTTAEHVTKVSLSGADELGIDSAFSFELIVNTNDSGQGSLREFLVNSDSIFAVLTSEFRIPGAGVHTIALTSGNLPAGLSVRLDATTQPGYAGTPLIEVDGSALTLSQLSGFGGISLFDFDFNASTEILVKGVAIYGFLGGQLAVTDFYGPPGFVEISDNYIGVDASGTQVLAGTKDGILVNPSLTQSPSSTLLIENNLVLGSLGQGIHVFNASSGSAILNNQIGVALDGSAAGNLNGIVLRDSTGVTVDGNTIGNSVNRGIDVVDSDNITISNNNIGVAADGLTNIGNGADGIFISSGASDNEFLNNTIANNPVGIGVVGASINNSFLGNSIFDNDARGIDLNKDGVDTNDALDVDAGSNNTFNYPVLSAALFDGSELDVFGSIDGLANQEMEVQFFQNTALDSSGFGEGEVFLGSVLVTTDSSGQASFSADLGAVDPSKMFITATATAFDSGTSEYGDTSEFSEGISWVAPPEISILNPAAELESAGVITFELQRSGFLGVESSVLVTPASIDALLGVDYAFAAQNVEFAVGESSKTVDVNLLDDSTLEFDESFVLSLSNPVNAAIASLSSSATGVILNDDSVDISVVGTPALESDGSLNYAVNVIGDSDIDITLEYSTQDGTAEDENGNNDYVSAVAEQLVIAAGDSSASINITVNDDNRLEFDESLDLLISAMTPDVNVLNPVVSNTIQNDDSVSISIADAVANEDTGVITFTVSQSGDSDIATAVDYLTADGTAEDENGNNDYLSDAGVVNFAPGESVKFVSITINPDSDFEPDETFTVQLLNESFGVDISDDQATGTILNDDSQTALLWGIDEDDGQLFSIGDYNNAAATFTDYGTLVWSDGSSLHALDDEIEAMAINSDNVAFFTINKWTAGIKSSVLAKIDLDTVVAGGPNEVELIGHIDGSRSRDVTGLTFDPESGNLYALLRTGRHHYGFHSWWFHHSSPDELIVINTETAEIDRNLGTMTGLGERVSRGEDLEFDSTGNLYATDNTDDHTYRINPANGRIIELVDLNQRGGLGVSHYEPLEFEGLAFDPTNDILLGSETLGEDILTQLTLEDGNNTALADLAALGLTDVESIDFASTFDGDQEGPIVKLSKYISEFTEDRHAKFVTYYADIVDQDSFDWNGATITADISVDTAHPEDVLSLKDRGRVDISGSNILWNGTVIASFSGGSNGDALVITFNADAEGRHVEDVLEAMTFENTGENPGDITRHVEIKVDTVNDGTSANLVKQVEVNPINDAAQIDDIGDIHNIQSGTETLIQNEQGETITISDDDGASDDIMKLDLKVRQGHLSFDLDILGLNNVQELETVLGLDFVHGDGEDDSRISVFGRLEDLNTALTALTYENTTGRNDVLTVRVNDLGNGGRWGRRTDYERINLFVGGFYQY